MLVQDLRNGNAVLCLQGAGYEEHWVHSFKYRYVSMFVKVKVDGNDVSLVMPIQEKSSIDLLAKQAR